MLMSIRLLMSVVLLCLLTACATSTGGSAKTEEQNKKLKTAKINAQLGIAYLERHNLQRAKQKLLLSLEQGPNIPEPWYSMAYFLEATGNKDDASIYYQKAIAVAPIRGDAHNNYGTFLCRSGDYRGSIEHFMLAVKDPTYLDPADAYENAGLCALKIPDKEMAAKYFTRALQEDPSRMVSERKLRELNKQLAMNEVSDTEAPVVTPEPVAESIVEPVVNPAPKRIAYNSLKQRHEEEENEDEADSGLVKVPDLLKAKPVATATIPALAPVPAPAKAVYTPAPKPTSKVKHKTVTAQAKTKPLLISKVKPKSATAQAKTKSLVISKVKPKLVTAQAKTKSLALSKVKHKSVTAQAKTKPLAIVNPLTHEKFQEERVASKPTAKKKLALKTQLKTAKVAATLPHKQSIEAAKAVKPKHRSLVKKHVPAKSVVTV